MTVIPVKEYGANQIKQGRKSVNMSQRTFAIYMGVSEKTVEVREARTNHPSGPASRILSMMEMQNNLTEKYPFVQ
jgi:putative transcriptional regulator